MIRIAAFVLAAWGLMALVGGVGDVLGLTIMLPATTAILTASLAFTPGVPLPVGVGVTVFTGYLEDLDQGAPVGTLALAYALCFLALRWMARRVALRGWWMRGALAALAVALVDTVALGVLWVLAGPLSIHRPALLAAASDVRWHVLATALAGPPVWAATDAFFRALGLPVAGAAVSEPMGGRRA